MALLPRLRSPPAPVFEEMGDVFFAAVNVARRLNVDPELALRTMTRRFVDRVERAEEKAAAEGKVFAELALDETVEAAPGDMATAEEPLGSESHRLRIQEMKPRMCSTASSAR